MNTAYLHDHYLPFFTSLNKKMADGTNGWERMYGGLIYELDGKMALYLGQLLPQNSQKTNL